MMSRALELGDMHRVQTNAQLDALYNAGRGYIFNHFTSGPAGARDNVLHDAGCACVGRMLSHADPQTEPSVPKMFFASIDEARFWLVPNLGPHGSGWKHCGTCQPDHMTAAQLPPQTPIAAPAQAGNAVDGTHPIPRAPAHVHDSWPGHLAFARPGSRPLRLPGPPRLASWEKAGHPDQVLLDEYLDETDELLRPHYGMLSGPLALRLDVGLPAGVGLLDQRDLDN
jgi:hypothetical protein